MERSCKNRGLRREPWNWDAQVHTLAVQHRLLDLKQDAVGSPHPNLWTQKALNGKQALVLNM